MASVIYYDQDVEFEMDRVLGVFNPGAIVHIVEADDMPWGYTPDGEGFYWYDTIAELLLEH
jgi:hypothetical protein